MWLLVQKTEFNNPGLYSNQVASDSPLMQQCDVPCREEGLLHQPVTIEMVLDE